MKVDVNFGKVVHSSFMKGECLEETQELKKMFEEAKQYITSFYWCQKVQETFFGLGYPGILSIFLFKVIPKLENINLWLWVIVGDIPPAYIAADDFPNPATALDDYIGEMMEWVEAVKKGKDVRELIPVNLPPTLEGAEKLESRLLFLKNNILANYSADLVSRNSGG